MVFSRSTNMTSIPRDAPPPIRTTFERAFPFVATLRAYTPRKAKFDLVAGLTVALFTIPQAMAYALIANMPPIAGIFAAVAASILGAAFGSSEFLVDGPTNAISVVLAANVAVLTAGHQPMRMMFLLTLMVGAMQLAAAVARIGTFTRFVSEPVLTGFTAGAGIYIAVNQLPGLLGIEKSVLGASIVLGGWTPPHNCLFDFARAVVSLGSANVFAVGLGVGTFALVRLLQWAEPKLGRRIPAPFVAVLVLSTVSFELALGHPANLEDAVKLVRDIQPIRRELPELYIRSFSFDELASVLEPAIAIATLGAVEAIAIAKALASTARHPFNANRQLVGEGVCNIGAAFVGGFASSGSFSRSAINYDSGAMTRMAGIISGVLILVIVMLFAPAANHIPIAVLAGTLIHIGLKLVNVAKVRLALQATKTDRVVLLTTFCGVLLIPHLEYALFLGIAVSVALALKRAEGLRLMSLRESHGDLEECPLTVSKDEEFALIDVQGELFFATAEELARRLTRVVNEGSGYVIVRLMQANNLDATCAEALAHVAEHAREKGGCMVLTGLRPAMYQTIVRAGLVKQFGAEMLFQAESTLLGSTHSGIAFIKAKRAEAEARKQKG